MAEFTVKLRVPRSIQQGDIIEVKAKIKHPSSTGLQLVEDASTPFDRFVRNQPAQYVRSVEIFYGDESISLIELNAASSNDPLISFKIRADQEAELRAVVTNHKRETVEATEAVQFG